MDFVPIPTTQEALRRSSQHWLPFLAGISKRSKESIEQIIDRIVSGYTQIALVWDGREARALVGIQYTQCGDDRVAEIVWLTGKGMKDWTHLRPRMEQYLREHMRCQIIRPICRPGWKRLIGDHGYKVTHLVMEKRL